MRIEASVVIDAPLEEIYDFLGTPENTPRYWNHMTSYESTSVTPQGEGSTMRAKMKFGLVTTTLDQVITAATGDYLEWKDSDKHMPSVQSFTLTKVDGGTRVAYRCDAKPADVAGRAASPVMNVVVQRDAWKSLDRLKEILESR